ncbi:MAG: hypothetical protein RL026_1771 [Pseudomonadota bacterium]
MKKGGTTTLSVDGDGDQVSIKSAEGQIVHQEGGAGAIFPVHAPQYPGSAVMYSTAFAAAEGGNSTTIMQQTSDGMAEVLAFYKGKLTAADLKVMVETTMADSAMLVVGTDSSSDPSVILNLSRDESGTTTITLMTGAGR